MTRLSDISREDSVWPMLTLFAEAIQRSTLDVRWNLWRFMSARCSIFSAAERPLLTTATIFAKTRLMPDAEMLSGFQGLSPSISGRCFVNGKCRSAGSLSLVTQKIYKQPIGQLWSGFQDT